MNNLINRNLFYNLILKVFQISNSKLVSCPQKIVYDMATVLATHRYLNMATFFNGQPALETEAAKCQPR